MKASRANKKYRTGNASYILTKETIGMTLLLFSALVLVTLLTGSAVFYGIGRAICVFMYGTFGYGAIPITILLGYLGQFLVFEKKLPVKGSIIAAGTAALVALFMLLQTVTARSLPFDSFGNYISACYANASLGWAGYTAGGAICGFLVYPAVSLATFVGACIIFSLLVALFGYALFLVIRRNVSPKASKDTGVAADVTEGESESYEPEPEPEINDDHMYAMGNNQEIVDGRSNVQAPAAVTAVTQNQVPPAAPPADEDEDKFSRRNLGRKILFENGEFAAESYRRNMIFSEDSYYSHPIATKDDYLASFTNDPDKYKRTEAAVPPADKTYTDAYGEEIAQKPVVEAPSNFVYGETPVTDLGNVYKTENSAVQPETADTFADSGVQNVDDDEGEYPVELPAVENSVEEEEQIPQDIIDDTEEEQPPVAENTPPVDEETEENNNTDNSRRLFGRDTFRGDRGTEDGGRNTENDRANLFDDDDDEGETDIFGNSGREISGLGDRGLRDGGFTGSNVRTPREDNTPTDNTRAVRDGAFGDGDIRRTETDDKNRTANIPPEVQGGRNATFDLPAAGRRGEPKQPDPVPEPPAEKPKHVWKKYVYPTLDLLDDYPENNNVNSNEIEANKQTIVETLASFKIGCEIANVTVGPAMTRYDVIIGDNMNVNRSRSHKDAIALALKKENVNIYLNYAKGALSIEVPNNKRTTVGLKTMLASRQFINSKPNSLTIGLGKNIDGEIICPDITKMPHLLVAGASGSGKSICLRTILLSLLFKYGPEDLRLILVDPKQVEFVPYDKLPHLIVNEIIYETDKAIKALNWAINEMERRYGLFKERTEKGIATTNLDEYNSTLTGDEEKLPKIVMVLDEFGDLMLQAKKDIEQRIIKLVQKARACGIHLVLATQRPSVDCITGLIKSNLPTRIGFKVSSYQDSMVIFDQGGAEKLLGEGDMYFRSASRPDLVRLQGCFASAQELQRVTNFIKANNETYFDQAATEFINKVEEPDANSASAGDVGDDPGDSKIDDTYIKALKYCIMSNQASVSMIQRRFPVGYIKACKIIDWMANMNYITQPEGSKPRKILLTMDEFINIYGDVDG